MTVNVTLGGTPPPPPEPPEPEGTFAEAWDGMIATRSWATVQATFDAYTGFEAAGYELGDLDDVGGRISSEFDGQVIEGRRGTTLRVAHNNVTVRGCLIEGGGTYGFDTAPAYDWTGTGVLVEHCTFDGGATPVDKAAALVQADSAAAVTFRYCDLQGWSSGFLAQGGMDVEYCWITRFYGSSVEGAHVSSLNARGQNVRFYRNLATEGGSPICSIYFDSRPVHNVEIRENLLTGRLTTSGNLPSYLLGGKAGAYETPATGIVVGGNYFGDTLGLDFQFGLNAGMGSVRWGEDGNVRTPDVDFLTGDPLA